jgi:uncharacterized protein YndB with AHSA1/START domain
MPDEHAILLSREGRSVLRFQRLLGHSPERVWKALTERADLEVWHPTPFLFEPAAGGAVTFLPAPEAPEMPEGRVLACEEPTLLAYTWGEDELRWTLVPRDEGCLLTLEHTFDDRFKAARDGAGWHVCLIALKACVDGVEVPDRRNGERLPGGWRELNGEYQERFGISTEEATPIPPM